MVARSRKSCTGSITLKTNLLAMATKSFGQKFFAMEQTAQHHDDEEQRHEWLFRLKSRLSPWLTFPMAAFQRPASCALR